MTHSTPSEPVLDTARIRDPYELDPADIQDPPRTFRGALKFLGPGMITSAAVVGSGELLTATTLGAQVVELGPRNDTIHKVNERVRAADLDTLSEIYEAILTRLFAHVD